MLKHETDLRAVYDMLVAEVTPLGVRAELDATQHRLEKVRRMGAAAAIEALVPATGVLQAQSSQSPDLLHRANPWSALTKLGASAGSRPPTNGFLPFELDFRMWKGPSRDRKRLEMSKVTTGNSAWRDRPLTVTACTNPAIRDLLMVAEQEKGPIDDVVEVALAAKVGVSLLVTKIRFLSTAIFASVKNVLHDDLARTT